MAKSGHFRFDGGAATYWGTAFLATLITLFTAGICYPFSLVLRERWKAKHTYIDGRQLVFDGSAWALFGNWLKWVLFTVLTVGIYSFWVRPKLTQWIIENTDFAPVSNAGPGAQALPQSVAVDGNPTTAIASAAVPPALVAAPIAIEQLAAQTERILVAVRTSTFAESATESQGPAAAGWYPDPLNATQWKYFDGQTWTDHTSPM